MEETIIEALAKMASTKFATWLSDNSWTVVDSKELKRRAYVNASKNTIYLNGSDYHYTKLINEHGKTIEELYDIFVLDERERLKKENKE